MKLCWPKRHPAAIARQKKSLIIQGTVYSRCTAAQGLAPLLALASKFRRDNRDQIPDDNHGISYISPPQQGHPATPIAVMADQDGSQFGEDQTCPGRMSIRYRPFYERVSLRHSLAQEHKSGYSIQALQKDEEREGGFWRPNRGSQNPSCASVDPAESTGVSKAPF